MYKRKKRKTLAMECAILAGLVLSAVAYTPMTTAQGGALDAIEDQPAEKVFHNIQVLKGMRAGDLQGAMSFIASSLGVDCDYCHRGEDFGKDVRKEKSRAREMIQMVWQINQGTFHGENKVNCFTCHQGRKDPLSLAPIITPATPERKTEATAGALPGVPLPSVDEVLNHYVQALGGQAALDGVKSRIVRTAPLNDSDSDSKITIYQKAPAKVLSVEESPSSSLWVGFNGARAWAQNSKKSYWGILNTPRRSSIMRDSELYQGSRIKSQYSDVRVKGKEKIGEHDSYIVVGTSPESTGEEFFFDAQTGLLLRRHIVEQTIFGEFQMQADFEDYRQIGGVKMPFIVRWSSPGDAYGTKVSTKIVDIQQNVRIEDEQFNGPPSTSH